MKHRSMKAKIQFFPITMFAIIMGLSGLTIAFEKFLQLNWLPEGLFIGMLYFTTGIFIITSIMYILKTILFFNDVKADFNHKIKINFFSAITISLILLSVVYKEFQPGISKVLWWTGVIAHTFLMLYTISFWIRHNFEIQFMNPAWFIPVVGNMLVPIAGVIYMPVSFSYFYFSVGFFFWIILFAIFMNRAIFHQQLPQRFIPTLFILLAPPAVGFLSYMRITGEFDLFAQFMLNIAFFFLLLIIFLAKSFKKLKFFISWWAFTFPLTAITVASAVAFQSTHLEIYKYLAFILMGVASLTILFVGIITVREMLKGEIFVAEE